MKTTLIIFLFLISIFIYIIFFFKIKIEYKLLLKNNLIVIRRKVFGKEKHKEIKITVDAIIEAIREKKKLHENIVDVKFSKFSIKDIWEILSIIEIENLRIALILGTPFVSTTISIVTALSTLIPIIYQKTDNRNGRLIYKIEPYFNDFKIDGEVDINFKFTILKLIWIKRYLKKTNNKQKTRRRKYEQSSYTGLNEYSYE